MDKMKAISWDKLRRLVGRKKSKDRDTDSSGFQRSYSFKRASVRKSGGRRAGGSAALGAAAIAANTSTEIGSSAPVSTRQHEQFHKSNGQLSSCSTRSNNSSAANKLPKAGYQEVTVNVDVIADGKNILKQEQVFELKLGDPKESAADVKVALVPHSSSVVPPVLPACRNDKKMSPQLSSYDEEDDEVIMNKWIRMRNQGGPIGLRQRAENLYRMMTEDDSDYLDEEELGGIDNAEDKYRKEMVSPIPTQSSGTRGMVKQQNHTMEADGEVFEDEFYLAMLAESPRPLRRSTDSALSRLTSDSSHSRSRSRLDDNLDYSGGGVGMTPLVESDSRARSSRLLSACSNSALDLIHESSRQNYPYHQNNSSSNSSNNHHRRRQQSPSVAVPPTPPPSSCAQNNIICEIGSNNDIIPVQKTGRAKRDIHKSTDDLVPDKNSPDSGSYHHHHHYGSSGKLSESKHGSGSSVSCSRDYLLVDSKEVSPSPDLHLSPSHHVSYPTSTEMLLSRQPPYSASSSSTCRRALDDPATPKSFWWTQKPGSTMTTSSGASKDSGFSLGRSWAWGLANKVFGKRGAHGAKGPVLSVSKEGYFQRTNLRRTSGRRPASPIPLRSPVTRKGSSKKRRSGRGKRNHAGVALSAVMSASNSAGTSNNHRLTSSPSPSSPSLVKSTSIDNIVEDDGDHPRNTISIEDNEEMENEIISKTNNLTITSSSPRRCTSPTAANNHNENNEKDHSIFEHQPVSIYQTHAVMSRRQRMLQRQQQHQQFQVFATPNSSEPLIFVPPERRKSCHSSSAIAHSKKSQPVPYSKTVFEIRNHCIPLLVPGVAGPRLNHEPVELLRLPRLRCDKTSCEKSVLITKVSGPFDNDGRLSRASCASGASSSGGGDCTQQQSRVGHGRMAVTVNWEIVELACHRVGALVVPILETVTTWEDDLLRITVR